jgi:hypothetical protein
VPDLVGETAAPDSSEALDMDVELTPRLGARAVPASVDAPWPGRASSAPPGGGMVVCLAATVSSGAGGSDPERDPTA